jgi:hypothetical protein
MSGTKPDDLDAVRAVVDAIKDFKSDEQQRIFRWVAEKLGLPQPYAPSVHEHTPPPGSPPPPPPAAGAVVAGTGGAGAAQDIRTFVDSKKPRNDVQFAATVAYYYRFEALQAERKAAINGENLQEACRKVGRDRFSNPSQTLRNAHTLGLLDKGSDRGTFSINSVGENLVAMTLPGDVTARSAKNNKKKPAVRAAKKKAPAKPKKG